jgi:hypothetical protein
MERDQAKTSFRWFWQWNSKSTHGKFTILWGMLERYNVSNLTEGIDLEQSKLRDRVKNSFLTLRSWRSKTRLRRWAKGFPRWRRALGSHLAHPREVRLPEVRIWERGCRLWEKGEKREATIRGLNTLGSALDRTLSGSARLCLAKTLFLKQDSKLGIFQKKK